MDVTFVGKAKLTKQGQVTLPGEARKELSIETDSDIFWYRVDGHLVVTKELMNIEDLKKLVKKR